MFHRRSLAGLVAASVFQLAHTEPVHLAAQPLAGRVYLYALNVTGCQMFFLGAPREFEIGVRHDF